MRKSLISLTLALILLASMLSMPAHASVTSSPYLQYYSVYFSNTGNTIKVNYIVQGTEKMDKVGVTEIYLYERVSSNDDWSLVMTWLSSDPNYMSTMIGTNTTSKVDKVSYAGTSTYQYKAYVTVYAEKNGGSDSRNLIVYY